MNYAVNLTPPPRTIAGLILAQLALALTILLLLTGCAAPAARPVNWQAEREKNLRGTFGDYDAEPRLANQHVDVDRLIDELRKIQAPTYNFLVHHRPTDWEDLHLFLPKARAHHIKVWVTLVPPSEPPFSVPFGLDYHRWAVELARLSLRETNLVAWSIDDFSYDAPVFTADYIRRMYEDSHAINPRLAFVPCLYYYQMKPARVAKYRGYVDGILFPYRHEKVKQNLKDWDTLETEIAIFRQWFGVPVIVDVYASGHSQLGSTTPEYVRQVMTISHRAADGVLIFCHQYEASSPEKYQIIKTFFQQWAGEPVPAARSVNP